MRAVSDNPCKTHVRSTDRLDRDDAPLTTIKERDNAPLMRRVYWRTFKQYMQDAGSIRCARVTSDGWIWHSTDISSGKLLSVVRVSMGEIGVKYTLSGVVADTVFSFLESRRETIDAAFDDPPVWRGDNGSYMIETRRPADMFDRHGWNEQFYWLRRQAEAFHTALWPLLGRDGPSKEKLDWDEQAFLRETSRWNPNSLRVVKPILSWADRRSARLTWGHKQYCGSVRVMIPHCGFGYQPLSIRSNGTFALLFTQLKESPLFWADERREELLHRLNRIEHFLLPREVIDQRPVLPLSMLSTETATASFLDYLDWFVNTVRAS